MTNTSLDKPSTRKTQQGASPIELGVFQALPNPQKGTVVINNLQPDKPLVSPIESFLKAGAVFLSSSLVHQRCPHAALNLPPVDHPDYIFAWTIRDALDSQAEGYTERFGVPNHNGRDALFTLPPSNTASMTWGDGAVTLTVDKSKSQVSLKGVSEISVELLVDIFVTLLRDPFTAESFPNYSAPHLRRWGENAFDTTRLKAGIPSALKKGDLIEPAPEPAPAPTRRATTHKQVPRPEGGRLVMPPATGNPPRERSGDSSPLAQLVDSALEQQPAAEWEARLEKREEILSRLRAKFLEEKEAFEVQQAQLTADRKQLDKERKELLNLKAQIEQQQAVVDENTANSHRLAQEAQKALAALSRETEKNEAIKVEIALLLQTEVIDSRGQ
jgi:hypothetical protein